MKIEITGNPLNPLPPDPESTQKLVNFYGTPELMEEWKKLNDEKENLKKAKKEFEEPRSKENTGAYNTWDGANVKLGKYIDRNLDQIKYIFGMSIAVMLAGFIFILIGILQAGASNSIATIGIISGVITEFIGATFLFIYRSTIQQASTYYKTLERLNSIGIALQIMYTISDESKELEKTKVEIIRSLLSGSETK